MTIKPYTEMKISELREALDVAHKAFVQAEYDDVHESYMRRRGNAQRMISDIEAEFTRRCALPGADIDVLVPGLEVQLARRNRTRLAAYAPGQHPKEERP